MSATVLDVIPPLRDVRLSDRWEADADRVMLSGVQAVVRALLDQRRADVRDGVRSGGFVSGYQGSPLGGLDIELGRLAPLLAEVDTTFQAGLNEELAATSVWGSQLAHQLPEARCDGVVGMWFGKNPGLDRAADPIRHATISGVAAASAAVAVVGDDPDCKSSTLPSSAERTLSGLLVPVLAPASVADVLRLGGHAFRMSRAAGLWTGLKVVADVADATATVSLAPSLPASRRLVELEPSARLLGAASLEPERHLMEVRLPAALAYARAHALNPVVVAGERDTLGIVACGSSYAAVRRAFDDLGVGDAELRELGVRLLKLELLWPLDGDGIRRFADGLERVLVVEDKLPFVEQEVRAALYGTNAPPAVLGKRDAAGETLLPTRGTVGADDVARALARLLGEPLTALPSARIRLEALARRTVATPLPVARVAAFCSGCPHNSSTRAGSETLVGVGIGCHVMVVNEEQRAGEITGVTQMGGEGAQWIGMAPFTARRHFTQNVGDGTFHHSASLAVRAAVAAGVDVTYKLLYNDAVAMTGGQRVQGVLPVPELTRMLAAEGVARTVVTTDDVGKYRGVSLAAGVEVRDRAELDAVERELAAVSGVTVLVHDQMCAAERRRLRRRGTLPRPTERVWINERVCEGCGDCGDQSGCLSVEPVETPFGRKTRIHQASCNTDMTCLKGDCPSFLTVVPGRRERTLLAPPTDLPEPAPRALDDVTVRLVGIGGTGVVTVAQVLSMAAHLDGHSAAGLDQTGMSQKAGPVVSDVRLSAQQDAGPARATDRSVDVLLAFDLLAAADPRMLGALDGERTVAVVSDSQVPTAAMVVDPKVRHPRRESLLGRIERRVREVPVVTDAQGLSQRALGDHVPANMLLLGAAWQLGAIPVSWAALTGAVELNGAAVETNLHALGWGRAVVAAPEAVEALFGDEPAQRAPSRAVVAAVAESALPDAVRELVQERAHDLDGFGGMRAVRPYLRALEQVATIESERTPGETAVTAAVARRLHQLTAYKDEYEVARLHLLPEERARREREFGPGAAYWLRLHPPLLRALGLRRKLRLGRWSLPLLVALRSMRGLRGTALDPFGRAEVRRVERALPREYLSLVETALDRLAPATAAAVLAICDSADTIRGYEEIKLRNVERWRSESALLLAELPTAERAREAV